MDALDNYGHCLRCYILVIVGISVSFMSLHAVPYVLIANKNINIITRITRVIIIIINKILYAFIRKRDCLNGLCRATIRQH